MDSVETVSPLIKTALFIDFDNIYLGLMDSSREAARRFATQPYRWLAWIERGMPSSDDNNGGGLYLPRSVLLRHCYANPQTIQNYRSDFTRAAFSVIDCPAITGQANKNSADIRMVMDVMDTLEHKTRFDEFILLSGDSDFMPLLLRLRTHDRRTAIVTVGPTAGAYKAAADRIIEVDTFIIDALGLDPGMETAAPVRVAAESSPAIIRFPVEPTRTPLKAIAFRLGQVIADQGEIRRDEITQLVYKDFDEFRRSSNWLGYGTKRRLTEEVLKLHPELMITDEDAWKVIRRGETTGRTAAMPETAALPLTAVTQPTLQTAPHLRTAVYDLANRMVHQSSKPVLMVTVANEARRMFGSLVDETAWAGAGSFRSLLESCPNPIFKIAFTSTIPGVLYDPERHQPPAESQSRPVLQLPPAELEEMRTAIFELVNRKVRESEDPVLMSSVADEARSIFGDKVDDTDWAGAGTFRNLLEACPNPAFRIALSSQLPGILYDPERHEPPSEESIYRNLEGLPRELADFIRRVSQVTATPRLSPENYAMLFEAICEELRVNSYNPNLISKNVRDSASRAGENISRKNIWFILVASRYGGYDFNRAPEDHSAAELAEAFRKNTINLCLGAQWELSEHEQQLLDQWILGKADPRSAPAEPLPENPDDEPPQFDTPEL